MSADLQFFDPPIFQLQIHLEECRPVHGYTDFIPPKFRLEVHNEPDSNSSSCLHDQDITTGSGKNVFVNSNGRWLRLCTTTMSGHLNIDDLFINHSTPERREILLSDKKHDSSPVFRVQLLLSACEIGKRIRRSQQENFTQTKSCPKSFANVGVQSHDSDVPRRTLNAFAQTDYFETSRNTRDDFTQTDAQKNHENLNKEDVQFVFRRLIIFFAHRFYQKFHEMGRIKETVSKETLTDITLPTNSYKKFIGRVQIQNQYMNAKMQLRKFLSEKSVNFVSKEIAMPPIKEVLKNGHIKMKRQERLTSALQKKCVSKNISATNTDKEKIPDDPKETPPSHSYFEPIDDTTAIDLGKSNLLGENSLSSKSVDAPVQQDRNIESDNQSSNDEISSSDNIQEQNTSSHSTLERTRESEEQSDESSDETTEVHSEETSESIKTPTTFSGSLSSIKTEIEGVST